MQPLGTKPRAPPSVPPVCLSVCLCVCSVEREVDELVELLEMERAARERPSAGPSDKASDSAAGETRRVNVTPVCDCHYIFIS